MGAIKKWPHGIACRTRQFVSTPGNHLETRRRPFRTQFAQFVWLTNVSVDTPSTRAIVAIGDSITDGMRSTPNANRRWPDA